MTSSRPVWRDRRGALLIVFAMALSMPLAERRQRHQANFKALAANDLSHWAERFLATLDKQPAEDELPLVRAASA